MNVWLAILLAAVILLPATNAIGRVRRLDSWWMEKTPPFVDVIFDDPWARYVRKQVALGEQPPSRDVVIWLSVAQVAFFWTIAGGIILAG